MTLSQSRVRELFNYNPKTGDMARLITVAPNAKAGEKLRSPNKDGYYRVKIDGSGCQLVHRVIYLYMTGSFPKHEVDHIDGNRTNNRWGNLRDVTNAENTRNMKISRRNTSGVLGVSWSKASRKWLVRVGAGNKASSSLGLFSDIKDAEAAAIKARKQQGYHPNHGRAD